MVVDAGGCDDSVEQTAADRTSQPIPTPMMGEMVSLGDVGSGYLEAWLAPSGGLVDDSVGCTGTDTTPADGIVDTNGNDDRPVATSLQ